MKVENMRNPRSGHSVPNQFLIIDGDFEYFQSYRTIIVKIDNTKGRFNQVVYLDGNWNCSKTTSKYRNQFLGETTKETKAKIASGEYILADLN